MLRSLLALFPACHDITSAWSDLSHAGFDTQVLVWNAEYQRSVQNKLLPWCNAALTKTPMQGPLRGRLWSACHSFENPLSRQGHRAGSLTADVGDIAQRDQPKHGSITMKSPHTHWARLSLMASAVTVERQLQTDCGCYVLCQEVPQQASARQTAAWTGTVLAAPLALHFPRGCW